MKDFFNRPEVNTRTKHMIFMAIQINLLLWGCESWALRVDLLDKLERFVNRKVRSILNLNMWHVKDQHITTKQLREKFNDILSVRTLIDIKAMKISWSYGSRACKSATETITDCICLQQTSAMEAFEMQQRDHVGKLATIDETNG